MSKIPTKDPTPEPSNRQEDAATTTATAHLASERRPHPWPPSASPWGTPEQTEAASSATDGKTEGLHTQPRRTPGWEARHHHGHHCETTAPASPNGKPLQADSKEHCTKAAAPLDPPDAPPDAATPAATANTTVGHRPRAPTTLYGGDRRRSHHTQQQRSAASCRRRPASPRAATARKGRRSRAAQIPRVGGRPAATAPPGLSPTTATGDGEGRGDGGACPAGWIWALRCGPAQPYGSGSGCAPVSYFPCSL
nr:uncharacterized protein LOC127315655 [Lolium perenne]